MAKRRVSGEEHKGAVSSLPTPTRPEPKWRFPALPYIDIISDDPLPVDAFWFDIQALEEVAGIYSTPVFKATLAGLRALSESPTDALRSSSFTLFAGEALPLNLYCIAVPTDRWPLSDFFAPYLRDVAGFSHVEPESSSELVPVFRYDQGYVIQYSDPGLEGTSYLDTDDNYGSGLTIYRRSWMPWADEDRRHRKSRYGVLVRPKKRSV